jgi:hypothetical protein
LEKEREDGASKKDQPRSMEVHNRTERQSEKISLPEKSDGKKIGKGGRRKNGQSPPPPQPKRLSAWATSAPYPESAMWKDPNGIDIGRSQR